jgi:hypothetical protein
MLYSEGQSNAGHMVSTCAFPWILPQLEIDQKSDIYTFHLVIALRLGRMTSLVCEYWRMSLKRIFFISRAHMPFSARIECQL